MEKKYPVIVKIDTIDQVLFGRKAWEVCTGNFNIRDPRMRLNDLCVVVMKS